jgi:hypothetical protein
MAAVAFAVVLVLAGCSAGYAPESGAPEQTETDSPDHLGYYNGYWYNDTLDIDPTNGLTESEKRALVSRAMARVQLLRGLEFEEYVEVEIVTRETFRSETGSVTTSNPGDGVRALDNAQHEALFLVGPDEDVIEVRRGNRGDTVLGFYQPSTERLVIVSANDPATLDDELTLAHELLHALQDQHFNLSTLNGHTLDAVNARNGLVEGDASVVEQEYQRNCETGEWECVDVETGGTSTAPGEDFHVGVYLVSFFPYAEGPTFIRHHRDRGGWERIDAMYDDVPSASAEVVYPETYGSGAYGQATVTDRSAANWQRVRTNRGVNHSEVGQSGLVSMFAYTAFEGDRPGVIDPDEFRNLDEDGRLDRVRPFTYHVSYPAGWYPHRSPVFE